jgi:hypothetical protein
MIRKNQTNKKNKKPVWYLVIQKVQVEVESKLMLIFNKKNKILNNLISKSHKIIMYLKRIYHKNLILKLIYHRIAHQKILQKLFLPNKNLLKWKKLTLVKTI